jgi:hypothetical protein
MVRPWTAAVDVRSVEPCPSRADDIGTCPYSTEKPVLRSLRSGTMTM